MAFLKCEAANICNVDDSDLEKIKKINKYVCDKVDYDYSEKNCNLMAFVKEDRVICSGYAESFNPDGRYSSSGVVTIAYDPYQARK